MPHCDDDTLSLLALGEDGSAVDTEHLASCPQCVARLDDLRRVVDGVRGNVPRTAPPVPPPPAVWERIAAETGVGARPAAQIVTAPAHRARRARPGWLALVTSAAAGLLVGLVGGILIAAGDESAPGPAVVASVDLVGLGRTPAATGEARVVESAGGRRLEVRVDERGLAGARTGFLEVWLIDGDVVKMVPVGVLRGPRGDFAIPDGLDLAAYPVIDVSVEPLDGDPRHSGDSVLRGTIQA